MWGVCVYILLTHNKVNNRRLGHHIRGPLWRYCKTHPPHRWLWYMIFLFIIKVIFLNSRNWEITSRRSASTAVVPGVKSRLCFPHRPFPPHLSQSLWRSFAKASKQNRAAVEAFCISSLIRARLNTGSAEFSHGTAALRGGSPGPRRGRGSPGGPDPGRVLGPTPAADSAPTGATAAPRGPPRGLRDPR